MTLSLSENGLGQIKKQRMENANNRILAHLNINSFRNKVAFSKTKIQMFDIFMFPKLTLILFSELHI